MPKRPDHLLAPRASEGHRARPNVPCLAIAGVLVAGALAAVVHAQSPTRDPNSLDASPRVVDQVGDRNSLSHSLRVMPVDLSPHGFERVYAVPGRDDLLMRTNGALYAVFAQSTYGRDPQKRGAMRAVIPAATVFYIGRPDFRTIRSTGMRDLDFMPNDASRAARPSSALGSVHGVTRLDGAPIDGRATNVGAQIVDGRAHHPPAVPEASGHGGESAGGTSRSAERGAGDARPGPPGGRDSGSAGADGDRDDARGTQRNAESPRGESPGPAATPAPTTRPVPAPPPPPLREEQPGFRDRIDELLRRAKKPS